MTEFLTHTRVLCPYCGQSFLTQLDSSGGDQEYVEDCQVCCRPIHFGILTDADLNFIDLVVRREDE